MELYPFIIRRVEILVVKIDLIRRMEHQKNFLERRHTEVNIWFRHFRINNSEDDQVYILLWWRCLVVIDASSVAAPDTREVPYLLSACARMDIWGLNEVVKALFGAACCWYLYKISRKTSLQLSSLCTRRWRRYRLCTVRKEMKSTTIKKVIQRMTFKKVSLQFFLWFTPISSSRVWRKFINFSDLTSKKDDRTNRSPSREKLRRIQRIITLALSLLRKDYF